MFEKILDENFVLKCL